MPDTLDGLIGRGFKFVTVSELVAMDKPVPPKSKSSSGTKTTSTESQPEASPTDATTVSTSKPAAAKRSK
jgi:hypothetical protein